MKHLFVLYLLCMSIGYSKLSAQSMLPLDETGRISFAEIVKADSLKKDQLYVHAKHGLISKGYEVVASADDSAAGKLTAHHSFPVYARGYVSKKIHGKITYTAVIEVKDDKYRYNFTNFVFHYYKEDRNYKMVPSGKTKVLEEKNASGWQALWENHQKQTYTAISNSITDLKYYILAQPLISKEPAVAAKKRKS